MAWFNVREERKESPGELGSMCMGARDHALFHVAAKTSARLHLHFQMPLLPAACNPVEIYTTVKKTGSFVLQQRLGIYATNPTALICFYDGLINSSLGREGKLHARLLVPPTERRDPLGQLSYIYGHRKCEWASAKESKWWDLLSMTMTGVG
jgi:hypothetical protein